jgi:hypothetical protein
MHFYLNKHGRLVALLVLYRYSLFLSIFYIAHSGIKVRSYISWSAGAIPQSTACGLKRTSAANFLVAQVAEMRIAEQIADLPTSVYQKSFIPF